MNLKIFSTRKMWQSLLFPVLCLGGSAVEAAIPSQSRPNVLFIFADDMNDFVGPLRSYVPNLTPNMDRLAAQGVSFRNAEANGLYCAPSRVSLLTGMLPTVTGYYGGEDNAKGHMRNTPAIKDAVTIPQAFLNNGYATFVTGKLYHILAHAEYQYFTGDTGGSDGHLLPHNFGPWPWDGVCNPPGEYLPPCPHPAGRPPFNTLPRSGYSRLSNIPDIPPDPARGIPGYRGWTLHQKPWKYMDDDHRSLMPDEQSVKWATERLMRKREKPFFMVVGLVRSHSPWYAPDKYFDMFPLDQLPIPAAVLEDSTADSREGKLNPHDKGWGIFKTFYEQAGEQGLREILQAYLASIRFVDDQIGALMKALDESPAATNTLIVFTSDQGYHIGEKHRFGKNTCWERSSHVPLIFAGAGVSEKGAQVKQPVSLVDIYPTLLDLCSLPVHPNAGHKAPPLDGHTLVPFLNPGSGETWQGPSVALSATAFCRTVRSDRYRYLLYDKGPGVMEELYDMQNDPWEMRNLATNPEYDGVKQTLKKQLKIIGERKHIVP